jgi:hypothetical protein
MIDSIALFCLKNALITPFFACSSMYLILGFKKSLNLSITNIKKLKTIGLFIVFYFSIAIFYKNKISLPPIFDFLRQISFSSLLGVIWTFLLIELSDALGHRFKKPKLLYLWFLISCIAFGLYSISR